MKHSTNLWIYDHAPVCKPFPPEPGTSTPISALLSISAPSRAQIWKGDAKNKNKFLAIHVWPLPSPRAKRPKKGIPAAPPQPRLRGRGDPAQGPVTPCGASHALRPKGVRLGSGCLCSPPRVRGLGVAKRACVFGAGVHVGQARGFVFVEVAPCPCGQPRSYAVPLVCGASSHVIRPPLAL
jgi:hypothetical protein